MKGFMSNIKDVYFNMLCFGLYYNVCISVSYKHQEALFPKK